MSRTRACCFFSFFASWTKLLHVNLFFVQPCSLPLYDSPVCTFVPGVRLLCSFMVDFMAPVIMCSVRVRALSKFSRLHLYVVAYSVFQVRSNYPLVACLKYLLINHPHLLSQPAYALQPAFVEPSTLHGQCVASMCASCQSHSKIWVS